MPTLHDRVTDLEKRADTNDERVDSLEAWLTDESKLREISEKQIDLLKQADAIHERRIQALANPLVRRLRKTKRRK